MKSILTVITEAASQDLTTLDRAKVELGSADDTKNALIRILIREASGAIASYCKRVFGEEEVSEQFRLYETIDSGGIIDSPIGSVDSSFRRPIVKLVMARIPIVSISSIVEDDTTVDAADYESDNESGIIYRLNSDRRTAWLGRKVTVTYTGGYALMDSLPYPLERAALTLLTLYYSNRGRDPSLRRSRVEGIGEREYWVGSTGDNGALPPSVLDLIAPYRKVGA